MLRSGKISTKTGKSYRATTQVNKWNKAEPGRYDSRVVEKVPEGPGARQIALDKEKINADKHREILDKRFHQRR
jgi:hypothetical protein